MSILRDPNDLPEKIRVHVSSDIAGSFVAAFKTSYKPNATIPILWIVIHKNGLLFCSSHRTRGVYKRINRSEVDSIKLTKGQHFGLYSLAVVFRALDEADLVVSLPSEIDFSEIRGILTNLHYQIL